MTERLAPTLCNSFQDVHCTQATQLLGQGVQNACCSSSRLPQLARYGRYRLIQQAALSDLQPLVVPLPLYLPLWHCYTFIHTAQIYNRAASSRHRPADLGRLGWDAGGGGMQPLKRLQVI